MSDTLNPVLNRADKEEADFGRELVARLVGATITGFGATLDGSVLLTAQRDGETVEISLEAEDGQIMLYEVETAPASQEIWQ